MRRPITLGLPALLVLAVIAAASAGVASAEELAPNHTYAAGTRVEASSVGVSVVIPEGWIGRFGQDAQHQLLILGSNVVEGIGVVLFQSSVTAAQVSSALGEPQDLGAGVVLRPIAAPLIDGSRIVAGYRNETYIGRALALLGPARNAVVFFAAGPPKNETAYRQMLVHLGTSTTFLPQGPVAASPPQPLAATGEGGVWSRLLSNQALNYFSSYNSGGGGGGMASHRVLHLCADGRFTFSGDSLVTMNVPGATGSSGGRNGFRGSWTVEPATDSTAVLVLVVDGGRELRWQLRYDGQKTFLNGQRWLRERSSACR